MRHSAGPRHLEVYHDAGFFSCCTIRLRSIVQHFNEFRVLPYVDSGQQFLQYKTEAELKDGVDVTPLFFTCTTETRTTSAVEFNVGGDDEQFSDYRLIRYDDLSFFVRRYFSPSPEVLRLQKALTEKYSIDPSSTAVVLYRGGDKRTETVVPTHDDMVAKVRDVLREAPGHRLLVQSDELAFCDRMLDEFDQSFTIDETPKISKLNSAVQYEFPADERQAHALAFLATLRIISDCEQIVLNSGNVALWACLFRGNAAHVHQNLFLARSGETTWL